MAKRTIKTHRSGRTELVRAWVTNAQLQIIIDKANKYFGGFTIDTNKKESVMNNQPGTPQESFETDAQRIDETLDSIKMWWRTQKRNLKVYQKQNPKSWQYVGAGAELRDVANQLEEIHSTIRHWNFG